MRARTVLSLTGVSLLLVVFAALAVLTWITRESAQITREQTASQDAARAIASLLMLTQEYTLYGNARPAQQWRVRHAELVSALQDHAAQGLGSSTEVRKLKEQAVALGDFFVRFEEANQAPPGEASNKRKALLQERFLVEMQELVELRYTWARAVIAKDAAQQTLLSTMLAIAGVVILLLSGLTWMVVHRQLLQPLRKLEVATRRGSPGSFEEQVAFNRANEIGDACRAVDAMAVRLLEAQAQLKRSNEDLERFAYVASHDLQEPLRMVTSYGQLLMRRHQADLPEDAKEFVAFMVDGGQRAQELVRDLLSLARLEQRAKPFEYVSLNQVLDTCLKTLSPQIQVSQAQVTHGELPHVHGDFGQLVQLLTNLVGNALKFSGPNRPRVHVSATQVPEGWQLSVKDEGIGIDPKFFDRIFVMFQRLHSRAEHPGTGIGLAICKRVVERHGGRIWVQSAPGQGAEFFVLLPYSANNPSEIRLQVSGAPVVENAQS